MQSPEDKSFQVVGAVASHEDDYTNWPQATSSSSLRYSAIVRSLTELEIHSPSIEHPYTEV